MQFKREEGKGRSGLGVLMPFKGEEHTDAIQRGGGSLGILMSFKGEEGVWAY